MKFVKKPIVVEAIQFIYGGPESTLAQLREFMGEAMGRVSMCRGIDCVAEMEVKTLEDGEEMKVTHIATNKDWIIKGVKGEFYACKPDIFEQTYEAV